MYQIECHIIIQGEDRLNLEAVQEIILSRVTDVTDSDSLKCDIVFQPIIEVTDEQNA